MFKSYKTIIWLGLLIAGGAGGFWLGRGPDNVKTVQLPVEKLELADSEEERAKGLMDRVDLCENCGMLFTFEDEAPRSFWMHDTPTSLDMIYFDRDGVIVAIYQYTQPNSDTSYPSYAPVQYVLEMPAGYAKRNNLQLDQKVDIEALKASIKS